jgi:phage head maturation protease
MRYKSAPAALTKSVGEAGPGETPGEFEAIVSVFNVVDYDNDVVRPGAFAKSIQWWRAKSDVLPVLWHHRLDDPRYNIGAVIDIDEIGPGDERIPQWADEEVKANGGLWIKARIDVDDEASDIARAALRVLKARRTTQFSYGYDIPPGGRIDGKGMAPNELLQLHFFEVSTTQIGANTNTELGAVKGHDVGGDNDDDDDNNDELETKTAQPKLWPGAAMARAECDLLVADLQYDEAAYRSLTQIGHQA